MCCVPIHPLEVSLKRILYLEPSACSVYLEIGIFLRYLKFHEKFIRVEHKRIYMYVPIHISNIIYRMKDL